MVRLGSQFGAILAVTIRLIVIMSETGRKKKSVQRNEKSDGLTQATMPVWTEYRQFSPFHAFLANRQGLSICQVRITGLMDPRARCSVWQNGCHPGNEPSWILADQRTAETGIVTGIRRHMYSSSSCRSFSVMTRWPASCRI